jgi:TetR/AcrR family transcriptional regulator, repressor of fatR-cypB operon
MTDVPSSSKRDFLSYSPRERILAAALKMFVENGYFNTSIPDLSRESKCSVGSIYHVFENKENIAQELYIEGIVSLRKSLKNAIREKSEIKDIIKELVRAFLEFSEINQQLAKYIWLCRHNEFMHGIIKYPTVVGFDLLGRILSKAIKEAMRKNQIASVHPNIIWSIIFGIPLAYTRDWLDGYNKIPPTKVSDEIAEMCLRALSIV